MKNAKYVSQGLIRQLMNLINMILVNFVRKLKEFKSAIQINYSENRGTI